MHHRETQGAQHSPRRVITDDGGRVRKRETSTVNPAYTWFALDEWDALSDEQRADLDGDIRILY